jgi:hypothetical protein
MQILKYSIVPKYLQEYFIVSLVYDRELKGKAIIRIKGTQGESWLQASFQ